MKIFWNEESHLKDFVELNNAWIEHYFELEEHDRKIAADPGMIIRDGGHILTITENDRVVGCCALFKNDDENYELARMTVAESERGKGIGKILMENIFSFARRIGAKRLFLISNTKLEAAIQLYTLYGFKTTFEGQHPSYRRGNIVMEKYVL